jgi:phage gp36-like protein
MSYATVQDLVDRFGEREIVELTDRKLAQVIDETIAQRALDDASAEIDGYLASRCTLPLAHVPSVLVRICADMARYNLSGDNATEVISQRYKDAVAFLTRVSNGQVSLGLSAGGEPPSGGDAVQMESGGRVFDRDDSKGYI